MARPLYNPDRITISWKIPPEQEWYPYLDGVFGPQAMEELTDSINDLTDQITDWMQKNRVWQDRTEAAKHSLKAEISRHSRHYFTLRMFYSDQQAAAHVYYDIYLENMQAGKFSILIPAFIEWMPVFEKTVAKWLHSTANVRKHVRMGKWSEKVGDIRSPDQIASDMGV